MLNEKEITGLLHKDFHDACGVGVIAETSGKEGRRVIELAIRALRRMEHRGASGADNKTGDGTGILFDLPQEYFKQIIKNEFNYKLKNDELTAVAMVFTNEEESSILNELFINYCKELDINYIGVREVLTNKNVLGETAQLTLPLIKQYLFVVTEEASSIIESQLYLLRKKVEKTFADDENQTFICSLSSKTIVYKGLMTPDQFLHFYSDLNDPDFLVKMAMFHQRFSTNTVSTWSMAQPFRMLAHNGEINTIKGNRLWMKTREDTIQSELWKTNIEEIKPICSQKGSDSFSLDNVLEFLNKSGRNIYHSMMMLIPQPYYYDDDISEELKYFYIYHENHLEPWDGPAAVVFTDGNYIGAKLDRNGLRPLRYSLTKDGLLVMASETGVIDIDHENLVYHHHMQAGEIFAVSLDGKGIINDKRVKELVLEKVDYTSLVKDQLLSLKRLSKDEEFKDFAIPEKGFNKRLRIAFGFDKEDLERFLIPMAISGRESIGSMGDDAPPAVLSNVSRRFYDFFKQTFAQVTNPPIDPIRERHVMSLFKYLGSEENILLDHAKFDCAIRIESPILSPREIKLLKDNGDWFPNKIISILCKVESSIESRLDEIKNEALEAVKSGAKILFLSDEDLKENMIPIPMLLVVSALHQFLIENKVRNKCSLLCFTGDVVEDHHAACLIGFGASAVYPYISYELIRENFDKEDWIEKLSNYRYGLEKGLLKIMAKMGISTISSYHGSMLFHSLGLSKEVTDKYFPSVQNYLGGINLNNVKEVLIERNRKAFSSEIYELEEIGKFRFRKDQELHGFAPDIFKNIQKVASLKEKLIDKNEKPIFIRDLFELKKNTKINLEQVENQTEIVKRFGLGAISFGAISEETHRALAKGANSVGARSNTGEGGEHSDRFNLSNPNKSENCYIKQIASGRFGVTTFYLIAAKEIQIKMAQGAKPGEGGQLPGEKVTLQIANERHTTPGVPLISPPPHHDIYSIEDIAQLIFDLKQVNPRATVCVKLVAQPGIGIVAAGVVKAGADTILVSGGDGGTGASPLGSLKHTGFPWEIGLLEVHRTLLEFGLRDRVVLRVDGGLKNGRDVIIAAILGAEEYDFGTSALIALGCVMARKCHQNNCPVGIATQDENLRAKFKGKPENLANYLTTVAEDVRNYLSEIGFYSLSKIVGKTDLLKTSKLNERQLQENGLDLSWFLDKKTGNDFRFSSDVKYKPSLIRKSISLDEEIMEEIKTNIITQSHAVIKRKIYNTDRAIGTMLSGTIAFLYGSGGFNGNIQLRLEGTAGQSFGAFLIDNLELRLAGVANDYVAKGMCGGLISIRLPKELRLNGYSHSIVGNVALYGATGGKVFIAGRAGERFAVRNSGATAVVEGVGNHCCEYMTRGIIIILGSIGKNFGAGMTGGSAYIYNNNNIEKALNNDYVRVAELNEYDYDLIAKLLTNFKFHTDSPKAQIILSDWELNKLKFQKIIPKTEDIIDFKKIYDLQYSYRMGELLNE